FTLFKEYSHLMQFFGLHPFPSFILVGIGYPSAAQYAGLLLRMRDYSPPSQRAGDMEFAKSVFSLHSGLLLPEPGAKNYHGAEDFRRFIGEELIPLIDQRYETVPGNRTYFGHSGGGLFGLYTLCTQPDLFRNYILSSPGALSYKGDDFYFHMM